jgi:hypothetical protein
MVKLQEQLFGVDLKEGGGSTSNWFQTMVWIEFVSADTKIA